MSTKLHHESSVRYWIRYIGFALLLVVLIIGQGQIRTAINNSNKSLATAEKASKDGNETSKRVEQLFQDRIKETDRRRIEDMAAAKAKEDQDKKDAATIAELKRLADGLKAVTNAIQSCTVPTGQCAKDNQKKLADALAELQRQHTAQETSIQNGFNSIEFEVHGTVEQGQFQGTAKPCQAVLGVGNTQLLPGVACAGL